MIVCVTLLGWVGWWIGERVGLMTALLLSTIGGLAGVFLGYRVYRDYLE